MVRTEFDRDQFDEAYPPGIERSWWNLARNHVIRRAFTQHVPADAKVLEVGCGPGIVTAHLRSAAWDVTGVDLGSPLARGVLAGDHLMLGTNALELPAGVRDRFTALALFDVIEHVSDAPSFLTALMKAFPNVRQVVVTVPARQELWTSFDDHYGHFRRYDRRMLRMEFAAVGLHPERIDYFFHGLYPAIAINNVFRGRTRAIRFDPPRPGFQSWIHAVIASAFAAESRLFPGSWVGSSILGIAQVPRNLTGG